MSDDIVIRPLQSQSDYEACVALQYETWGSGFRDAVPASILQVNQRIGGVSAGAFDGAGTLVGFVFGMTGVEHGTVVHWSDMLAVRADARNRGVGRRLKEFQRREVERVGGSVIYWTFDPLVARNAHVNFNLLGARAVRYVRDMYGQDTGSDLHRGIGTDRMIVAWDVKAPIDARPAEKAPPDTGAGRPILGDVERPVREPASVIARRVPVAIAVPQDITEIQRSRPQVAADWRAANRAAFEAAFAGGYTIDRVAVDQASSRCLYLMSYRHAR